MGDFDNNQRYAVYSQFVVGDEESGYKLTVGGYEGNAGMYRTLTWLHTSTSIKSGRFKLVS
jgi:hypothetical protein